ncbi:MAG: hypothetical protein A2268_11785 [Candidatus Raymondbacteria bacterium RifOxyA12_full_50_37]|uniref:Type II secretion system protein GspF domain-containing protein n=1 Tax=Candidatus Raymondbacteria bacterium RIFOXYD12_FULL_49_13 TaxID=1817890 RepID=A0A1F7FLD5_UNCRA|nr:MAG: hypothetical protein A2268_11785 [Candidatus Raymondbacteria bacterium RifOxyA12_full_50_37]OGJ98730.1 MAG: hypothetical protein A2453_08260 [Candidatus Raymondbacteria bacterium RIFOXYC2_FULL_50_21]OGJ99180.1 MAG: hypothetical protein A2350_17980 [Candidatus Raymondbacteria bacterium RifOxyB12_full_50_8]OGK07448.1 MAG: hypothetical protein A2519_11155 [Candidatus Raymondbacteria bacterium RIFOXYD12_FULL_49_13]OGK07815.1 MAG: hypothetical protein A2487_00180 [Candidatus Raymondbacteria 
MPKFSYNAQTGATNYVAAASIDEAALILRKKRIIFKDLRRVRRKITFSLFKDVSMVELSQFTRQFAAMAGAGLPLVEILDVLSEATQNRHFNKAVTEVLGLVRGGASLAEALKTQPRYFNELYCNMVGAGEASGSLNVIMKRLANYLEKSAKVQQKVKGAFIYPSVVIGVAAMALFVIMTFVVPAFSDMFSQMGRTLPLPTRVVIGISNFIGHKLLFIVLFLVLAGFAIKKGMRTQKGSRIWGDVLLRTPFFGTLAIKTIVARFARLVSTLVGSGIPVLEALKIAQATAGNHRIERGLGMATQSIAEGRGIADTLDEMSLFPNMVIKMIQVGERTGELPDMLSKIAEFYEDEVDRTIDALTSVIEPVIILLLGVCIGGILLSMYLPMFEIINLVQ